MFVSPRNLRRACPFDMPTPDSIVILFQARRKETWRIIRPWVFITIPVFTVFFLMAAFFGGRPIEALWQLNLIFGGFLVLFISLGRIAFAVQKHYRCPACDSVPTVRNMGVLVDPAVCPNCVVRLK